MNFEINYCEMGTCYYVSCVERWNIHGLRVDGTIAHYEDGDSFETRNEAIVALDRYKISLLPELLP